MPITTRDYDSETLTAAAAELESWLDYAAEDDDRTTEAATLAIEVMRDVAAELIDREEDARFRAKLEEG